MYDDKLDDEDFRKYAEQDSGLTEQYKGTGMYQCYCQEWKKQYKNFDGAKFCDDYSKDQLIGLGLSKVVSVAIVVINFVLRTLNMGLISFIGYYTESQQTLVIKSSIFIS